MEKLGVFLARMQPLHEAHLYIIRKALKECDRVVVMLGSSNKIDMIRNPYSLELRKQMVLEELPLGSNIEVYEIPDWGLENDLNEPKIWGRYFYYNVVSRAQRKHFHLYYSDGQENLDSWFADTEVRDYITYELMERSSLYDGLSATKIRQAFIEDDTEYILAFCPPSVLTRYDMLREYYLKVNAQPKPDFVMDSEVEEVKFEDTKVTIKNSINKTVTFRLKDVKSLELDDWSDYIHIKLFNGDTHSIWPYNHNEQLNLIHEYLKEKKDKDE